MTRSKSDRDRVRYRRRDRDRHRKRHSSREMKVRSDYEDSGRSDFEAKRSSTGGGAAFAPPPSLIEEDKKASCNESNDRPDVNLTVKSVFSRLVTLFPFHMVAPLVVSVMLALYLS
jgi:hypothetical protein